MNTQKLPPHLVRAISVEAVCDPRSVEKMVRGETLRAGVAYRIEAALRARGLEHLLRPGSEASPQ